jgi:hypothetical protein
MPTRSRGNANNKKTKKSIRPSPSESATSLPEGSIRKGGSGNRYVVVIAKNGVPRWSPIESVEIKGIRLLTVNHLAKNIGNPVVYYSRMYEDKFPTVGDLTKMEKFEFTFNGNIQVNGQKMTLREWFNNEKLASKKGNNISILGEGGAGGYGAMQVDSKHPQHVSDNVMNMEAFVKV